MSHDPMCPQQVYGKPDPCRCVLIARVRADERQQIADLLAEQERLAARAYRNEGGTYNEGVRDAFDLAETIARGES